MSKPEPKLAHMPPHIKQTIADATTNMGTKFALGMVSKEFRDYVNRSPPNYTRICIVLDLRKVIVKACVQVEKNSWRHQSMEFSPHENARTIKVNSRSNWKKTLLEKDYRKAALEYCLELIGRPNTTIDEFRLEESPFRNNRDRAEALSLKVDRKVIMGELEEKLKVELKHPLLVKHFRIDAEVTHAEILELLPYLKPGFLVKIEFLRCRHHGSNAPVLNLDLISETQQWKQAKQVALDHYICNAPLEHWAHFDKVQILQDRLLVPMKTIVEAFLNNPSFQNLNIRFNEPCDLRGFKEYLAEFERERDDVEDEFSTLVLMRSSGTSRRVEIEYSSTFLEMTVDYMSPIEFWCFGE